MMKLPWEVKVQMARACLEDLNPIPATEVMLNVIQDMDMKDIRNIVNKLNAHCRKESK